MCGISAILRFSGDASADLSDLARMHLAQIHRGPDGEGAFAIGADLTGERFDRIPSPREAGTRPLRLIAALRRLRITDTRAVADQPLVSADRRAWVMLNGAIYNYRELTQELKALGHDFRTGSDTEVVLEAYRRWGTDCFRRFNGMWAILIVDLDRRRLIGSRDRVGIKPYYYAVDKGRLLLASEPWTIAQVQGDGPAAEPARFFEFLRGYPPQSAALTFFRGVHPVPAASWFSIGLDETAAAPPRFEAYWKLSDFSANGAPSMSFAESAERFRELLTSAVGHQSLADVKVGSLLSGGFDSSTVVSLWAELAQGRGSQVPDTLSIAWDDPQMSERPNIEAIAAKTGVNSHILELRADDIWGTVEDVIRAQAQPLLGQELIAQYKVYRFARENGDVVVMDGNGADEVQAGLPNYEAQMVLERFLNFHWIELASELRAIGRKAGTSYFSTGRSYLLAPLRRHLRPRQYLMPVPWLDESRCNTADPAWQAASTSETSGDSSLLNRTLYRETRHTNVPTVLMYSDRNSMAHSVEARFPYLDHRILELCFSLPAAYKVGFGRRKRLLFETARKYLPQSVVESRDKKRFVMMNNWMPLRSRHAQAMRDAAHHPAWSNVPYVDVPAMQSFVEDYLAGRHDDGYTVWRVFTASRWMELFRL